VADLTRYKYPLRQYGKGPIPSPDVAKDFIDGARNNGFGRPVNIEMNGLKVAEKKPLSTREKAVLGTGGVVGLGASAKGLYDLYHGKLPSALTTGLSLAAPIRQFAVWGKRKLKKEPGVTYSDGKEAALKKFANNAAELAALGMLQVPTAYELYHDFKDKKPMADKAMHGMELGGLGLMSGNIIRSMMRGH
jgi:hypothetical protein